MQSLEQTPPYLQDKVYDEEIQSFLINFVDEEGKFHPLRPLNEVLNSIDRTTQHLIQVVAANPRSKQPPTCKIFSKEVLRATSVEEIKKATRTDQSKQVEVNWAIDAADLSYRLKKIVDFLEEGRRVEILIMAKRRSRKASVEEAQDVFHKVMEAAEAVEGSRQCKPMEGSVGSMVKLCFESQKKQSEKQEALKKRKESSDKVLEKRKKLEDKDFERRVLERQQKFESKKLEKARRESMISSMSNRSRTSHERTPYTSARGRY